MNWDDLRVFLAIARAGTLSAAARSLDIDQATVSRRLSSLEDVLKVQLVDRLPRESRLTAIGQEILHAVGEIEAKALAVQRMALTASSERRAKVTITAPPILARYFFAPNMRRFAERSPAVQLSIFSEPQFDSLSRLDADLAVRLSPAIEDTDISRKIGRLAFHLYAARDYPNIADSASWEFIGYTDRQFDFAHKRWLYELIGNRRVACEMTDLSNQYEAACTGVGVAGLPAFIGDADQRLIRLPTDHAMLTLDIWIAMHPDRRKDQHVRNTANGITELIATAGLGLPQ
jgi:DNA-binding transcriptional LysR family regulator